MPGIGARTVRSLALVAEVVHGAPCRFADPARFSLAHGGKDRQPFPVPTKVYDQTIAVLKAAVARARLGQDERLDAIRRLDREVRRLERHATRTVAAAVRSGRTALLARLWRPQRLGWERPKPQLQEPPLHDAQSQCGSTTILTRSRAQGLPIETQGVRP